MVVSLYKFQEAPGLGRAGKGSPGEDNAASCLLYWAGRAWRLTTNRIDCWGAGAADLDGMKDMDHRLM